MIDTVSEIERPPVNGTERDAMDSAQGSCSVLYPGEHVPATKTKPSTTLDFLPPMILLVSWIGSFLPEGHQTIIGIQDFSEKICSRPSCTKTFPFDPRVPHKKFCCDTCYDAVRLARKRLLHWYRLTRCLYALEIYRLLGGLYNASG
ncbi:MAG TPA: hypothetical protein DEB39_06135 [Planctomycetaceae bacterium]|nr:hypothetical protein [Planctomycetaceae bacterium]